MGQRLKMDFLVKSSKIREKLILKKKKVIEVDSSEEEDMTEPVKLYGDPKNKFFVGHYRVLSEIGSGGYGHVITVKDTKSKHLYAVKVIKKKIKKAVQLNNEATINRILRKKTSPFIVIVHQTFQTNGHFFMLMDLMDNATLNFHLHYASLSDNKACYYTACMLLALQHLHSINIVHKDVKPHNMVLDRKGNIKLFDFGLSVRKVTHKTHMRTKLGTGNFKAPEYYKEGPILRLVDFWALAVTLHLMLTAKYPSKSMSLRNKRLSKDSKDLLKQLFKNKPENRLGSGEFGAEDIMKHHYFKDIDFTDLQNGKISPPKIKFNPPTQKSPLKLIKSIRAYKEYIDVSYDTDHSEDDA